MARKTVYIPDPLHERVEEAAEFGDSYSGIVQDALGEYLDQLDDEVVA